MRSVFFLVFFLAFNTVAFPDNANQFLVITDVHLKRGSWHTMSLNPAVTTVSNDMDERTFEQLIENISLNIQQGNIAKPKFLLYLGDAAGHVRLGYQFVWKNTRAVLAKLADSFLNVPIFYVFGNNDAYSRNYGAFVSRDATGKQRSPINAALSTGKWDNGFLSRGTSCVPYPSRYPCISSQNRLNGYYAAYIETQLKLIALNTIMYSKQFAIKDAAASQAQFTWLENELDEASRRGASVLLAMHIPLGKNISDGGCFLKPDANQRLVRIIKRYHTTIIGVLAAHTHMDEIKVIQDKNSKNIAGVYVTPGLSTSHGNAPGIRSYTYQKMQKKWQLYDYTTFYFTPRMQLQTLYRYRNVYCQKPTQTMTDCLGAVTPKRVLAYYTAGNPLMNKIVRCPEKIYMTE